MVYFELTGKFQVFGLFVFLSLNHPLQPFPLRPRSGFLQEIAPVNSPRTACGDAGWRVVKIRVKYDSDQNIKTRKRKSRKKN
jgi:hypothetical protein